MGMNKGKAHESFAHVECAKSYYYNIVTFVELILPPTTQTKTKKKSKFLTIYSLSIH